MTQYLISTDLDGTLLDHHDYAWADAKSALDACRARGVPVILNTSKTAAETLVLRKDLGLTAPIVIENGSALLFETAYLPKPDDHRLTRSSIPGFDVRCFGAQRSEILSFISDVRLETGWRFSGFNDWGIDDIVAHTGLSEQAASLAAQKQHSEPFLWQDTQDNFVQFAQRAAEVNLAILQGGRFFHLQGETDKAKPLVWLLQNADLLFGDRQQGNRLILICLGDNHNDVAMLNLADRPVCVRSRAADYPVLDTDQPIYQTRAYGPAGWDEAVSHILN